MTPTRDMTHEELLRLGEEVDRTSLPGMMRTDANGHGRPLKNIEMLAWRLFNDQRKAREEQASGDGNH